MRTGKTHLALKQTTRLKIRLKYWFKYLFRIKSPSRELSKALWGDEFSEREYRKMRIRCEEDFALEKLNRAMEKSSWKKV